MADAFDRRLSAAVEGTVEVHRRFAADAAGPAGQAAEALAGAVLGGRQVLTFGNGGSATDAQHLAAELIVRFTRARRAVAAVALTADTAVLTAAGNDLGFDQVFARQVEGLGRSGDVAVGITTSGRSANVLAALRTARARGMVTIALTGQAGLADAVADIVVAVPSTETARIQEVHRTWIHAVCGWVEDSL